MKRSRSITVVGKRVSSSPEDKSLSVQMPHYPSSLRMPESGNSLNSLYPILCLYDLATEKLDTFGQLPI